MKKAQLLENMVRHPDMIYANATAQAGNWSKYPERFRVVGLSHDGTQARIRGVRVITYNYLTDGQGGYLCDEENNWIPDTRPVRERTVFEEYDTTEVVSFRLIAECDTPTEKQLVDAHIAHQEWLTKRDALFTALADAANYDNDKRPFYGDVNLALTWEQVDTLTAILSNARQTEGV